MSKNLDEKLRLQSEKRQEWIREIRGERLQRNAEGTISASHLASSSAAPLLGRNQCPGTHCSLIEKEEREDRSAKEFEIREKTEKKTGWQESNRRREEK